MKNRLETPDITSESWKGYTIDEIRYRRAYLLARGELERMRLASQISALRQGIPSIKSGGIASRLLKSLTYMDYAYLAFKVGTRIASLISRRRRR